jgi:hypothetical protein
MGYLDLSMEEGSQKIHQTYRLCVMLMRVDMVLVRDVYGLPSDLLLVELSPRLNHS